MRKIGGLAVVAALLLAGCSAPAAEPASAVEQAGPKWVAKDGQTLNVASVKVDASALPAFKDAASKIPAYSSLSSDSLASIGRDLCEHYAGGFTTEDLRASSVTSNGDGLAALGEAAKATVCATT